MRHELLRLRPGAVPKLDSKVGGSHRYLRETKTGLWQRLKVCAGGRQLASGVTLTEIIKSEHPIKFRKFEGRAYAPIIVRHPRRPAHHREQAREDRARRRHHGPIATRGRYRLRSGRGAGPVVVRDVNWTTGDLGRTASTRAASSADRQLAESPMMRTRRGDGDPRRRQRITFRLPHRSDLIAAVAVRVATTAAWTMIYHRRRHAPPSSKLAQQLRRPPIASVADSTGEKRARPRKRLAPICTQRARSRSEEAVHLVT